MGSEMRRRRRWRWTGERRARIVEVLAETGNVTAAAEAAGISWNAIDRLRKRDAGFDRQCEEAALAADERLGQAESAFEGVGDEFQVIRRTSNGRWQLAAVRKGYWTGATEAAFFAYLRETGSIAGAARSVGSDPSSVWERRRKWPAFARRWDEVLEEASVTLEFRLACQDGAVAGGTDEAAAADAAAETGRAKFDPELALRFLKWRHETQTGRARRRGSIPAPPTIEEVTEKIVRQVEAIKRHRARGGKPPRDEGGGDSGLMGTG
jgi:molybdenum-dependent DNA-binding transcriptional regulator ModE